jgi:hypothetical protein
MENVVDCGPRDTRTEAIKSGTLLISPNPQMMGSARGNLPRSFSDNTDPVAVPKMPVNTMTSPKNSGTLTRQNY